MTNPNKAAIYARSSKDRSDVSIDAQRRALHDLAAQRGLAIAAEFTDAVESGKDDDRPAFQRLLREMRSPDREWSHILVLDTARVARRQMLALIFEQECDKRGITLTFRNVPDSDPVTMTLLKSILRAMDEWHSLTSRQKGLAGMAENVRQGWRAGGRAPRGYQLEYHATGAIRDGIAVKKSKLVPDAEADEVASYLKARAAGEMRNRILKRMDLPWNESSLNDTDWQALTYAGHTVWNVHAERAGGSTKSGAKRRPRSEWMIQRNTHVALISDEEAEAILNRLETQRERRTRSDAQQYLLTGLLCTPDGQQWAGDGGGYYRVGKGRRVAAYRVDEAVLERVFDDLAADKTAQRIAETMRESLSAPVDGRTIIGLERRIKALDAQISRTIDLVSQIDNPAPILRRVSELEGERAQVAEKLADLRARRQEAEEVEDISADDVRAMLRTLHGELRELPTAGVKQALEGLIEHVSLDEGTLACHIHYRISGVTMASRRVTQVSPVAWIQPIQLRLKRSSKPAKVLAR